MIGFMFSVAKTYGKTQLQKRKAIETCFRKLIWILTEIFQATIAAGKDVKDVEANAAGSEQDKDAKNKKVIFDLEKTIIILAFSLRLIREKGFQSQF